jgi:membrane-bound lytic murein transglycosylase D
MANRKSTSLLRRCTPLLACAPLLFALLGCPGDAPVAAAPSAAATAPSLAAPQPTPEQAAQQVADTQAQQATDQAAAAKRAQQVQNLIAKAEGDYNSGLNNYNTNHLDAARQDFDAAVDTMLSSGFDLKNDPQLSDEFDRLLSAINSLELVALRQGNGFSPALEEAPVDAAEEVTFPPNPELVGKVAAELKTTQSDLPLVVNDYVAGWISAFTTRPALHAHLKSSLQRAGKYKTMIEKILRDNGVPQDLIYQAITESGFQPQVVNRKSGAGGMWQFMPFGNYGLARNGYFDERFDPEKSTVAYAKYMKFLYSQTGDWYLAMAAYDWGLGRVQHLVSKTGYADYWQLYRLGGLPAETKAYIPSVIAAVIMARNPSQYGLTDLVPDPPVLSDTITTDYAIDMRLVADLTNSTVPEIVSLNPALLRLSTPTDIPYDLHIPPGTHDIFLDRLKEIPEENRSTWRFHVVKAGETLDEIASALHARAAEVATYNEISANHTIEAGDELVVPVVASVAPAGQQRYTLRKTDTLVTVADRFGVTVEQLRQWNHLTSSRVSSGRSLYVAAPIRLAPNAGSLRSRRGRGRSSSTSRERTSSASPHASSRSSRSHTAASQAAPSRTVKHTSTARKKHSR